MGGVKKIMICILICLSLGRHSFAQTQKTDTAKQSNTPHVYFIITAGEEINAFFNDKPVQATTIEDFNTFIQTNAKNLRDSWVVVTGKPKTGTFDEVIKTLKRNKFKHITTNIKD
jgi:hypothetical protein